MYKRILYCFAVAALYLLQGCNDSDNGKPSAGRLPNLVQNYINTDKNPFGGYIAYQQLQAMYSQNIVRDKKNDFAKTWNDISYIDTSSLYVCIATNLFLNDEEINAMLNYVAAGNDLFISSGYIDEELMKRIGCQQNYDMVSVGGGFNDMTNTSVSLSANPAERFSFYYLPFKNYFSGVDGNNNKVLGVDDHNQPNFIVHFQGRGKLFLQCDVRAFSNYFLLKDNNYRYMLNAMAYTNAQPKHLYWDDYYNRITYRQQSSGNSGGGNGSNSSSDDDHPSGLSELAKYPSLLIAFWLALILLLLYIIFNAKRRQRIIKTIKPNENSTVNFTETIGRLYLQKKDNKNVADKMITYFNEYIRNNYFLNTGIINDDFITTLSRKSGVQRDKVDTLYRTIQHAQQSDKLDDYQLLSLNELIQNFYKTRN